MSANTPPGAPLLLELAVQEHASQVARFDALDSKGGIALAAIAALLALTFDLQTAGRWQVALWASRAAAVTGALSAAVALLPGPTKSFNVRKARAAILASAARDPQVADTVLEATGQLREQVNKKATAVKVAFVLLAASALMLAVASLGSTA